MTPTDLRDRPVSRRCALLGVGGVGAAAVLAACSSGSDGSGAATSAAAPTTSAASSPDTTSSGTPATSAATSAPGGDAIASLASIPVGGTAAATVDGENILLSQPTAGKVEAFSATCPHQGAQVQPDGAKFHCPLHGSEFDLSGAVTQGPAQSGLKPVAVAVSGDSVVKA